MNKWIVDNLGKVMVVALFVVLMLGALVMTTCHDSRVERDNTRVAQSQAGAATASGQDAVAVVGNRADADAASDALTRENGDAIRNAQGADAVVAAPVRDAAFAGLCRRAAYRDDPHCVLNPRP